MRNVDIPIWDRGTGEWSGDFSRYFAEALHFKIREILCCNMSSFAYASFSALARLRSSRQQNAFASDARRRKKVKSFASAQL